MQGNKTKNLYLWFLTAARFYKSCLMSSRVLFSLPINEIWPIQNTFSKIFNAYQNTLRKLTAYEDKIMFWRSYKTFEFLEGKTTLFN